MLVLGLKAKQSPHVAVVEMEGTIGTRLRPDEYVKMFRALEDVVSAARDRGRSSTKRTSSSVTAVAIARKSAEDGSSG